MCPNVSLEWSRVSPPTPAWRATSPWAGCRRPCSPRPPPSGSSSSWSPGCPPPASGWGPPTPCGGCPAWLGRTLSRYLQHNSLVSCVVSGPLWGQLWGQLWSHLWVNVSGVPSPGVPGGAKLCPPVGILTMRDSTAARFPAHGSSAIGLGRDFFRLFLQIIILRLRLLLNLQLTQIITVNCM